MSATSEPPSAAAPTARRARGLDVHGRQKPLLRGWIHAVAVPVAIAAGVVLVVLAATPATKAGAAVYMVTSIVLFGLSAVYHLVDWSPRVAAVFRRIDHANIFLLIAGTYTPLSIAALEWPKNLILLAVIWGGALLGVAFRIFWLTAPRWLYVPLYVLLGWAAVLFMGELFAYDAAMMTLVLIGGGFYTLGAVFYALKRPNPRPGVFGFHEMFHSCTVIAFLCQWAGILLAVLHPVI